MGGQGSLIKKVTFEQKPGGEGGSNTDTGEKALASGKARAKAQGHVCSQHA